MCECPWGWWGKQVNDVGLALFEICEIKCLEICLENKVFLFYKILSLFVIYYVYYVHNLGT